jgi:hypothetical protein
LISVLQIVRRDAAGFVLPTPITHYNVKRIFNELVGVNFPSSFFLGRGNIEKENKLFFVFIDVYIARFKLNTKRVFVGNAKSGLCKLF